MKAYPTCLESSADKNSYKLTGYKGVKDRITELLEHKTGSRLSVLLSDLIELKRANKTIIVDKVMQEVKDNPTRLEAVKTLFKLHGLLSPAQSQVDARTVQFNITPPDIKSLNTIIDKLERIEQRSDRISGKVE